MPNMPKLTKKDKVKTWRSNGYIGCYEQCFVCEFLLQDMLLPGSCVVIVTLCSVTARRKRNAN